jgi:hypothetical protein
MNGWTQKRRGAVEHLCDGRLTLLEYGAHDVLLALANPLTGVWCGSAKALAAICGAGEVSERQARHLLESLEEKGYVRRFATKRGHGNYPILLNKFEITLGANKGMRLNAAKSDDWRNPVYEKRLEEGLEQGVVGGAARGEAHAPFREGKLKPETEKKKQGTAATPPIEVSSVIRQAFEGLSYEQPFGPPEFQEIWADEYSLAQTQHHPSWTDVMERTIIRCKRGGIKVPQVFYLIKRKIEEDEVRKRYQRTPL